ncbi:hypothetical protein, partial [Mycolicibacterium thermoresistibile]
VELGGAEPAIGFNYLGRLAAGAGDLPDELWRIDTDALELTGVASRVRMPLMHTVEVNAGTLDAGPDGPVLQATWTWAPSLVDEAQ